MKWIKLALAGCVSLLAMTAHAQADFIITPIAFSLFAGPLGAVASFGAIYTGVQIAAYAAVIGAQLAFGPKQQKIDPGEMKNTFQEAETSEFNAVGRVKLGGLKAFGNTKGNVISRLIWHVKGPMVAVEQYFLGGREVTVEYDGQVSSPPWAKSSGSWAYIRSKVGDGDEVAWSELAADFPSLWTSAHRCQGIFQSLVRFVVPDFSSEDGNKKFQKLYQGGAPDCEVVARVSLIYDPRDPTQHVTNWITWKWSDNGILCAAHIMRSFPDLTSEDFDWEFIKTEASRADVLVGTQTVPEPRARCWGIWPSESKRADTMQQVLDSIGAEIVLSQTGLIRIRLIDDAPAKELTLTDRHIQELSWKSGPEAVERPNICRIKYYSPERGYDMGEINMTGIAWARVDDEVARYGEKIFDVELPFCPSPSQAQRIARRLFLQARADAGGLKTNMAGLAAWGVTYCEIEDSLDDKMMLCRIASPRIDDEAGMVEIPYIVWPQTLIDQPWDPGTMEAPAPLSAPDIQYESELPTPDAPSGATVVQYPDGSFETRVRFVAVAGGTTAEAVYRTYTAGNPNPYASMGEYNGIGSERFGYAGLNSVGLKVDFKCRFFNADDEGSYYSSPLSIDPMVIENAAPDAPTLNVTGSWTANVTAPGNLNVARVELWRKVGAGSWALFDTYQSVRPREVKSWSSTGACQLQAFAYTSNGTVSPGSSIVTVA